ncbi:MAG: DMT family transporter [Gemmobacter sp.]|nr:DMT family transporter [Gemmobacter sp.]
MARKDRIDMMGVCLLLALSLLFGVNQIAIKLSNTGFSPVFGAAMRSLIGVAMVLLWMRVRGIPVRVIPGTFALGLALGIVFAAEFLCLFIALDHSSVARTTVMLYSMPIWFALLSHFTFPGDRISPIKAVGLALAFGGMAVALSDRTTGNAGGGIYGDLIALGAGMGWALVAYLARILSGRGVGAEMQIVWMAGVSAPLLFLVAPLFGPFLRDPDLVAIGSILFQGIVVVAIGFIVWFWMLGVYPPAGVASFSFLSPVLAIWLGAVMLNESLSPLLLVAGAGVAVGLILINWPKRVQAPPA